MNGIDFTKLKQLNIDGIKLEQLFINDTRVWKGYKNWVRYSTESDGVTIYNGGLGYKNGYRIRSGGAELSLGEASCCGFIPVNAGDIVRVFGWVSSGFSASGNGINVYDGSLSCIGQTASNGAYGIFAGAYSAYTCKFVEEEGTSGVYKWVVHPAESGVEYIRISAYTRTGIDGRNLIVTINEEIT